MGQSCYNDESCYSDDNEFRKDCLNCKHSYVEDIWYDLMCDLPGEDDCSFVQETDPAKTHIKTFETTYFR